MSGKNYEQLGDIDFREADNANVPVDIWLSPDEDDDGNRTGKWELTASNYMPRKSSVHQGAYRFTSDSRDVLVENVKKYWKPLYVIATKLLDLEPDEDDEDGTARLYYWGPDK